MQGVKIFVGGLNPETDESRLRVYYSRWGEVTDAIVMKDYSGRSRGFGFVTFAEPQMANFACTDAPHEIDGKTVETKPAIPKGGSKSQSDAPTNKIFVGGLRRCIMDDDMYEYFSTYGSVVEAVVMKDKETQQSRGFGFVTFQDSASVEDLVSAGQHSIGGFPVDVKKAVAKEDMPQSRPKNFSSHPYNSYRYNSASPSYSNGNAFVNQAYNTNPSMTNFPPPEDFWTRPPPTNFGQYPRQTFSGGPVRSSVYHFRSPAPPYGR